MTYSEDGLQDSSEIEKAGGKFIEMVNWSRRCVLPCSINLENSPESDNNGILRQEAKSDDGISENASGLLFISSACNFVVSVLPTSLLPDSLKTSYVLLPMSSVKVTLTISKDLVLSSVIGWKINAKPIMAWKSNTFSSTLEKLLVPRIDWTIPKDKNTAQTTSSLKNLSWFVVYEVVLPRHVDEDELNQHIFQPVGISKLR